MGQEKLLQHYSKQAQWHYEQSLLFAQYAWSVNEKLIALRSQNKEDCRCETTRIEDISAASCCLNADNLTSGNPTTNYGSHTCACDESVLQKDSCMELDHHSRGHATPENHIDSATVRPPRKKKKKKRRCKSNVAKDHDDAIESEEDSGMEVDPAFREFLRQSAQFRMERDAEKKAASKNNKEGDIAETEECVEYVDVMCKGPEGTTLPPTAQNRETLYREQYGARGTALLSMETALQWQFNKFSDAMRPKPWPSIPLNM